MTLRPKYVFIVVVMLVAGQAMAQRHQVRRNGETLAHSLRYDPSEVDERMPEALRELLRAYSTKPRYAERSRGRAVEPLMNILHHQEEPFNRRCPYYLRSDGTMSEHPCVVGCVATSIEHVLTYYHYPQMLNDTLHGWETDHYAVGDVMPGTRIDWDNIRNDYRGGYTDEEANAIAELALYCGMAVNMKWGTSRSSASMSRAREPLSEVFGYKTVAYLSRAMYSSPKWNALLRHELENGRPICYTGHNIQLTGHAFNIDGVDEDGYYHILWGEGGDYDGYYDLDYLNPFEPIGEVTDLGQHMGLSSNHTALFMHPDDVVIDVSDSLSLEDAFAGVTVDNITFRRRPETEGFVVADFTMTNHTADSLNFTFEVLTYLPTDTAIFKQADYVALSVVNLAPGECRTWPVYCQFMEAGERILSFSADDETLPYKMNIDIAQGTAPVLEFGNITHQLIQKDGELMADISVDVRNEALAGCAGELVTYCLTPENKSFDNRHWQVMSIGAGRSETLTVRFTNLEDGLKYHFAVRCPWQIVAEYDFTADASQAVDAIQEVNADGNADGRVYDLTGRIVTHPMRGIYIKHGKKLMIP